MRQLEGRKTQSPRENGRAREKINHSFKQGQIASSKQKLLRAYSRNDGGKLDETAHLLRETDQNDDLDSCALYHANGAASLMTDPIKPVERIGPDQEGESSECGIESAQINDQEVDHDAFSRKLVRIFDQSISEDPGGPSGFLGNIDGHGMCGAILKATWKCGISTIITLTRREFLGSSLNKVFAVGSSKAFIGFVPRVYITLASTRSLKGDSPCSLAAFIVILEQVQARGVLSNA